MASQTITRQTARTFALNGWTIVGTGARKGDIRISRRGGRWHVTGGVWDKAFSAVGDAVQHGNAQYAFRVRQEEKRAARAAVIATYAD